MLRLTQNLTLEVTGDLYLFQGLFKTKSLFLLLNPNYCHIDRGKPKNSLMQPIKLQDKSL